MYENGADAKQYLRNSIIRHKGEPVMMEDIEGVRGTPKLYLRSLKTRDVEIVRIDSPEIDFSPVPLGYGEVEGEGTFYAARRPHRRWKQGLSQENLGMLGNSVGIDLGRNRDLKALRNTILGKFKAFKLAAKEVGPFHREFSVYIVGRVKHLEYKGRRVGSINDGRPSLEEKFNYLENLLEEAL